MAVIRSRDSWVLIKKDDNLNKGPLIRVEIAPGQFVKMYQAEALERGLIPGEKKKTPQGNKIRKPEGDKIRKPEGDKNSQPSGLNEENPDTIAESGYEEGESGADDFTVIRGVGLGADRALKANGIETFSQLMSAGEMDFLTPKVNKSIQNWRDSNG